MKEKELLAPFFLHSLPFCSDTNNLVLNFQQRILFLSHTHPLTDWVNDEKTNMETAWNRILSKGNSWRFESKRVVFFCASKISFFRSKIPPKNDSNNNKWSWFRAKKILVCAYLLLFAGHYYLIRKILYAFLFSVCKEMVKCITVALLFFCYCCCCCYFESKWTDKFKKNISLFCQKRM